MTKFKIKNLEQLKKIIAASKKRKKRIVFTNGCFDILHLGHIRYLKKARSLGDKLVVALNSDSSARKLKGKGRPVFPEGKRAALVAALECVDYVTVFNKSTPLHLIKALKPDVLVKGADWRKKDIVGKCFVESYGGKVARVPFVKGYSTSSIIAGMRIIDANLNRSREGLRVCEEITRFILEDARLTSELKALRHGISHSIKKFPGSYKVLLESRNSRTDVGKKVLNKSRRRNYRSVFLANIQRVKESLRVLEEFSKIFKRPLSNKFARLRFRTYELEKKAIVKF